MTPMFDDMARKLGAAAPPIAWLHCACVRRPPAMFGSAACRPGFYDANARGAALRRRRRRARSR